MPDQKVEGQAPGQVDPQLQLDPRLQSRGEDPLPLLRISPAKHSKYLNKNPSYLLGIGIQQLLKFACFSSNFFF